MKIHVFLICFYLFLSLLGACSDKSNLFTSDKTPTTSFAIIGDRTGQHEDGAYQKILTSSLESNPKFLIDVGDMIEGGTEKSIVLDTHWNEYMNLLNNIDVPFYHTPGNHDLWFSGQLEHYLHYIGRPYYSFDYNNIHFVILDNSRWKPDSTFFIDGIQLLWLKDDLESNEQPFTFIFCHKPFWDMSVVDSSIKNNSLHSYLLSQNVDVVVAGHYHNYFQTEYDGIKYLIVGRSGGASTLGHPYYTPKDSRYIAPVFEDHRFLSVTINDKIQIESHSVPIN